MMKTKLQVNLTCAAGRWGGGGGDYVPATCYRTLSLVKSGHVVHLQGTGILRCSPCLMWYPSSQTFEEDTMEYFDSKHCLQAREDKRILECRIDKILVNIDERVLFNAESEIWNVTRQNPGVKQSEPSISHPRTLSADVPTARRGLRTNCSWP